MDEFETKALTGNWQAACAVLYRASVNPELLEALMTPNAHREVILGVIGRASVMQAHLEWAASFDDAHILGRVVSNPKTPLSIVRDIRARAENREGDVWVHLAAYCGRVQERAAAGAGLHSGGLLHGKQARNP